MGCLQCSWQQCWCVDFLPCPLSQTKIGRQVAHACLVYGGYVPEGAVQSHMLGVNSRKAGCEPTLD
jgi:hypothetical protein